MQLWLHLALDVACKLAQMKKVIGILCAILGCWLLLIVTTNVISTFTDTSPTKATARIPAAPPSPTPVVNTSLWRYGANTDRLTDAREASACIDSVNELSFGFPYNGGSTGRLCFFKKKGRGMLVNLRISKGQFLCTTYDGCTVAVRVGDGPVQRFSAVEPGDYSSDVLVVNSGDRLLRTVTSGDRVRVAAQFYQEGQQTMEFQTKGFNPLQFTTP